MSNQREALQKQVFLALRDQGIASVLFRNATTRKLGLSITDSACLSLLSLNGTSTPTELARYTGLTSGSTTAMLDRLEKAGFIHRHPNPNDRRGVLITIDPHWQQTAGPLMANIQKAHQQLVSSYTEPELKTIADFLTRFTENVKRETEKLEKT